MISRSLQVAVIMAVVFYFIILMYLLNKRRLTLKYTLLWIFSGLLMLFLALFPKSLNVFAKLVGIYEPTNALFAAVCFCLIIILVSLTAIVSKMNEQIKRLIQSIALLEKRVRDQEGGGQK